MPGVQRQGCKDHRSKRTIGGGRARAVEARQILARTLPGDSICKLRIGVPPKPNETSADRLPAGELTDGETVSPEALAFGAGEAAPRPNLSAGAAAAGAAALAPVVPNPNFGAAAELAPPPNPNWIPPPAGFDSPPL